MSRLSCLFLLWIVCGCAYSSDEEQDDFVKPYSYDSFLDDEDSGIASLASNPMVTVIRSVEKSPQLFDTTISSSVDSIQNQLAPRQNIFDATNFGFNPIASESFLPHVKSAKLVSSQVQKQPLQSNINVAPNTQQHSALLYDIRTIHDPNYKVYKAEKNDDEGTDILAALKKNPEVAAYFQPNVNVAVEHPLEYRKQDLVINFEGEQNYKQNPYIAGLARFRRYAGGRSRENLKKADTRKEKKEKEEEEEDDDDPYNYKAEYISKPKAFDESPYSSPYKKKKGAKDEYEYPYSYDSGYDHKEYERIKELSEKQAAEIKQNPGNCQEVKRDGMSCMTCKDPKTGGNYESCSYVAEPKNNKYAYSKEKKYDSNDDNDEPEKKSEAPKKSEKLIAAENDSAPTKYTKSENEKPYSSYKTADNADDASDKYKAYYIHTAKPSPSEALRAASNEDRSKEAEPKAYNYQKALPGFYTDNEQKKDVEHVLAEFKKKDRSACKKVKKNAMTCFQCLDQNGLKHEECMFVSESAPKQSHLAYQELKEFTSKPATLDGGNEGAESQTVTTSSPPADASAAYASNYNKKLKRKKAPQSSLAVAATNTQSKITQKVKRSVEPHIQNESDNDDNTHIAPPEEFAGADSKGAFWAETMPRYSATLGVSLPEYMLARSEHEASFDEVVAGA